MKRALIGPLLALVVMVVAYLVAVFIDDPPMNPVHTVESQPGHPERSRGAPETTPSAPLIRAVVPQPAPNRGTVVSTSATAAPSSQPPQHEPFVELDDPFYRRRPISTGPGSPRTRLPNGRLNNVATQ